MEERSPRAETAISVHLGNVDAPVTPLRKAGEAGWFVLVATLFMVVQLSALRAGIVLTRPLWLDEVHTYLLASTPSVANSIRSLAAGADFNPPTVFLLYRTVGQLTGGLSELTMRLVAVACVIGALVTVYVLLREQFSRASAAIGTLAVWAQPVVAHAAFDARFYGPWLFATGSVLIALRRAVIGRATPASSALLALTAAAVCSVHYFGILSWAAAIGFILARTRGGHAETARRLVPALAGPIVLVACIPLYLDQRSALTVPTWNLPQSVGGLLRLLTILMLQPPTVVATACWGAMRLVRRRVANDLATDESGGLALGPQLLLAQGAVPVILAVFSLLVQPATEQRYWIVGAFVAAPLVAVGTSRSARSLGVLVAAVTLIWSLSTVDGERQAAAAHSRRVEEDINIVSRLTDVGQFVVFRQRHTLYPVVLARADLRSTVAFLDGSAIEPTAAYATIERDVARVHSRQFGFPRIVAPADLETLPTFYLVEFSGTRVPTAREFPYHNIEQVSSRLFRLDRR
jgi:hypothetical protein